ncbi:nima-like pk serine threonine-protein kinase nek1 [Chrysochromulina tobinii]|uniref:Nima-like pk serine threonine-protein kinase nek1 n=1 Tax=Chrysochromulina tobinii TaxID=1460289 RepID=A0A0M0JEA6_9EUKA|nr:nima-like pk serine threonine-protein kinase nek1 [Chrysochromulina tobinii]|eukprot:KOO24553.1 nima-like pk serine threonine-protein kinase nek1 [Chrysochromulina sp. CCMP291]
MLTLVTVLMAFKAPDKKAAPEQKANGMQVLSPTNATQLKAVFFSGDPWLIQCGSKADLAAAAAGDVGLGAHDVLEIAMPALAKLPAELGLLDCEKKLPSGKSTLDRFKLDGGVSPMLIFAANGLAPVQIVPSMLAKYGGSSNLFPTPRQQAAALVALVKSRATPQAFTFTKSEQMHAHCLKCKHCVLWLTEGEPQGEAARTLGTLLREYRTVAFGTVNTARYQFSLAKALPAPPTKRTPQVLAVRSTAAEGDAKKVTLAAKAYRGEPTLEGLRGFVSGLTDESLELTPLTKPPALAWRKQAKEAAKDGKEEGGSRKGGKSGTGAGSGAERKMSYEERKAAEAAARKAKAAAAKGGGPVDEVERRRRMALEEEELLRSMFDSEEAAGEEEADEAEETVNFDDEEGAHDDAQEDEGADMDEENEDEATMEVEDDGSDKQEL